MTPVGFPHSDIPGSTSVCDLPRLIAAYHVLHRLLVPRHPPCALSSLTEFLTKVLQSVATHVSYIRLSKIERSAPAPRGSSIVISMIATKDPYEDPSTNGTRIPLSCSGGDSGARTRSLRLAKPALSQLSYIPWIPGPATNARHYRTDRIADLERWWAWVDSNHPPHAYQACALTN